MSYEVLMHKAPTAFFEGLIWQQQYTKNGTTYKGAGLSFMTKNQSEAVASGKSSVTESIGPYIYEIDKIPSKAQLSAEMIKEITANCINRGVIISPKESKKAIDAFYTYLVQNNKSAEKHTVKHSDEQEDDDDVIDCTEESEDVLEHKAKSNLVRLANAGYEPSHDYNAPVSNPLNEEYYIYQKSNSGWFTASFNYPAGSSHSQYYAAIIKLNVFNGEIHDYDNGSKKPLTIQNLKQMILHAVTVKISGDKLEEGLIIDDATAARAAARAWADMQDDIAKINSRKRREANTSGKFEKSNSGKTGGGRIRRYFMMQHSAYTVVPAGESELYHHGILGMKWGVRRYQNPDGSLTAEGKKHYGNTSRENEANSLNKKIAIAKYGHDAYALQKEASKALKRGDKKLAAEYNELQTKNRNKQIQLRKDFADERVSQYGRKTAVAGELVKGLLRQYGISIAAVPLSAITGGVGALAGAPAGPMGMFVGYGLGSAIMSIPVSAISFQSGYVANRNISDIADSNRISKEKKYK